MAQFFQTFDDGTLGQPYPGFTTKISRAGDSVNVQNDFAANRKFLQLFKGGTQGSLAVGWDALNGAQDVEQLVLFKLNGAVPTLGRYGILLNRYDGSSEATTRGFAATFTPASSTPSIIISEDSVGTVHFTNYSWANNQMYWARFRVNGNDQQFKIWPQGSPEPATWTLSGTFAGSTIASPYSGLGNFQAWSNMLVYQVSAGTGGDTAPATLQEYYDNINNLAPSSTPLGVYGAGYGAPMGYGGMFGGGTIPAFTVESLDYNANAFIEWQLSADYSANAFIDKQLNITHTANAFIDKQFRLTYLANANIERQLTVPYAANANIERVESLSYTANAEIESFYFTADVAYTANARIERIDTLDYVANAFIEYQNALGYTANAFVEYQYSTDYTANAFVEWQLEASYQANAFIEKNKEVSYESNAFIEWQLTTAYSANANIERIRTLGYTASAHIERVDALDYQANARIERIESSSYTASAVISNPTPDKLPQTWEDTDAKQPASWSSDERAPVTWSEAEERQAADWKKSQESQPQQWSDGDNKQPTDWSRIYYD